MHKFMYSDEFAACIECGAEYLEGSDYGLHCVVGTDGVHGYDTSAHSLDNCEKFDETGECDHLAILKGCDCRRCA